MPSWTIIDHQNQQYKTMYLKSLKSLLAAVLLIPCTLHAQFGGTRFISDMDISKAEHPYGTPVKDKAVTGENLSIASVSYEHGIGLQAGCRLKFVTMNNTRSFKGKIGINDCGIDYKDPSMVKIPLVDGTMVYYSVNGDSKQFVGLGQADGTMGDGSVVFRILGDGKEMYNSGIIRRGEPARDIDVSLGGEVIEFIIESAGDGESGDHFDIIDGAFEYTEICPDIVVSEFQGVPEGMPADIESRLSARIAELPAAPASVRPDKDWLLDPSGFVSGVYQKSGGKEIVMTNGLVSRVFRVIPNLSTLNIENVMTGESALRAPSTEGSLVLDGRSFPLGGLSGLFEFGYSKSEWVDGYSPLPNSFRVVDFEIGELRKRMEWKQVRWSLVKDWNISGKEVTFYLEGPDNYKGVKVALHYAIYDYLPIISKWMDVTNGTGLPVVLDKLNLEELAFVEYESDGDALEAKGDSEKGQNTHTPAAPRNVYVESDWANTSWNTTYWIADPRYTSQVNYRLLNPCFLQVRLPYGPGEHMADGAKFTSFRNWIMLYDSEDRERKGLFRRHFRNEISPWTTENPIFMHCTSTDPARVREAVDQCVETGYEMVILSFGSGLDMEDDSEANYAKFKELADYAHSKEIEMGAYSLLASRWISDEVDIINPATGKRGGMTFGSSPCLSSEWGHEYFRKVKQFYEKTGMNMFEHDGSYSGDPCASTTHAHHNGLEDSQWKQRLMLQDLYQWMRANGIFMNVPDDGTFLIGNNKSPVRYREVNWSLPRDRQIILGRQNIYDGLWNRTPTMCWTFTPLVQYHGGGAAATLEPLDEHLDAYKAHMIQNYGSGVQSCYRGFRLYDTDRTRDAVKEVISWYKEYREILNSDVIHLRRPDGLDWDGIMHVNHNLDRKGLVMVYNPTDEDMVRTITLPLYYTGLTKKAIVKEKDGKAVKYTLDREYKIKLTVNIPANGYNWYVIE